MQRSKSRRAAGAAGRRLLRAQWLPFVTAFPRDVANPLPPLDEGVPMKNPLDSLSATIALGLVLTALLYAVAKVAMGA